MHTNTKESIDKEWISLMYTAKKMNLTPEEIRQFIQQMARENQNETKKE